MVFITSYSYSYIIDDPKCKCENCNCNSCDNGKCTVTNEKQCNCENCAYSYVNNLKDNNYEPKCECENCSCGVCKCENKGTGMSSGDNAKELINSILGSINNNYENLNGNIGERCCSKMEMNLSNTPDDTNLICVVSKHKINGNAVKFSYLGKEYVFCSTACLEKFKAEPMNYTQAIQCPVMGDEVDKELYTIYNGTKYYFCCKGCLKKFNENPEKYLNGYKEN